MIVKKYIKETLDGLERKYNTALTSPDPNEPVFYSKMALLEYCGWIEESLDKIAKRCVKGKLSDSRHIRIFNNLIVRKNHGFQYYDNFRPMMIKTIGIVYMEELDLHLASLGDKSTLVNELEAIKKQRNDAAHTWVIGRTLSYPAPSQTIIRLNRVYPILRAIYTKAIQINSKI